MFGQHRPTRLAAGLPGAGQLLVFDNGDAQAWPYSRVLEFETPLRQDGSYAYDPAAGYGHAGLAVHLLLGEGPIQMTPVAPTASGRGVARY